MKIDLKFFPALRATCLKEAYRRSVQDHKLVLMKARRVKVWRDKDWLPPNPYEVQK